MPENDTKAYEPGESFNQQPTHCCPHCNHEWTYTGDAERPTCPSCTRKVPDHEARIGEPTEYHMVALEGGCGDDPRFDTDVTIDTKEREGRMVVYLDLTEAECEAVWEQITGEGHEYPDDARQGVLEAMNLDVCTVQSAGQNG